MESTKNDDIHLDLELRWRKLAGMCHKFRPIFTIDWKFIFKSFISKPNSFSPFSTIVENDNYRARNCPF